jgi:hypothetical protein
MASRGRGGVSRNAQVKDAESVRSYYGRTEDDEWRLRCAPAAERLRV